MPGIYCLIILVLYEYLMEDFMKKKVLSFLIALAVISFFMSLSTCSTFNNGGSSSSPASGSGNYVAIVDFAFNPSSLTVAKGTTVYWTNTGAMTHTVTSTSGQSYDSGDMNNGAGFSVIFTNVGVNHYVCVYHAQMTATVTVTP